MEHFGHYPPQTLADLISSRWGLHRGLDTIDADGCTRVKEALEQYLTACARYNICPIFSAADVARYQKELDDLSSYYTA